MDKITYEVLEKLGVLSESPRGWTKELRLVDWNNRGPRYDLREWSPGDRKASRGITLSLREMRILQEVLMETELPEPEDEEEEQDMTDAGGGMAETAGAFGEPGREFGDGAGKADAAYAAGRNGKREKRAS